VDLHQDLSVDQPVVTIVIPCFNQERFLESTVDSLRAQTESRWEAIIVNDGSTDGSSAVAHATAQRDPRISVLETQNRGVGHARNAGLVEVSPASPYVLFLDGDDELEPTMLERSVSRLDGDPRLTMVHSLVSYIDEHGQTLPGTPGMHPRYVADRWGVRVLRDTERETPFESILALAGIIPSSSIMRRLAFSAVGGWDEGFGQVFEDTDLFLRLALHGRVEHIPERLVRHRRHSSQSTAEPEHQAAQLIKLHNRWRDVGRLTPEHRAIVKAAWRFCDHQLNWHTARVAIRRSLREHRPILAARFFAGSALITFRSCWPRQYHA
jgi:glycosyltransferase involved in cell wall biosynthesis